MSMSEAEWEFENQCSRDKVQSDILEELIKIRKLLEGGTR